MDAIFSFYSLHSKVSMQLNGMFYYIMEYHTWHTIPRNTIHMTIWQFYRANLLQDKSYRCSAETIFIRASPLYFRLMSHQLQWWLLKCKKLEGVKKKHRSQSLLLFTGIHASPQYWISCLKTFPLYDETLYFASPIPHWDATVTRCKLRQKSIVLMSMLAGHTVSDTVSKNKWPWESNLANSEKISTSCFPGFFFLSCLSSRS